MEKYGHFKKASSPDDLEGSQSVKGQGEIRLDREVFNRSGMTLNLLPPIHRGIDEIVSDSVRGAVDALSSLLKPFRKSERYSDAVAQDSQEQEPMEKEAQKPEKVTAIDQIDKMLK